MKRTIFTLLLVALNIVACEEINDKSWLKNWNDKATIECHKVGQLPTYKIGNGSELYISGCVPPCTLVEKP